MTKLPSQALYIKNIEIKDEKKKKSLQTIFKDSKGR